MGIPPRGQREPLWEASAGMVVNLTHPSSPSRLDHSIESKRDMLERIESRALLEVILRLHISLDYNFTNVVVLAREQGCYTINTLLS